jgi:microcystin-dependent protein
MSQPFIGEIRMFGGNFAPAGWALCAGQLMPISENDALFTLIGTTYGGDGQQTFGIPDLQGRVPVHPGTVQTNSFVLGQRAGTETVNLTATEMPSHNHFVNSTGTAGTASTPSNVTIMADEGPAGITNVATYRGQDGSTLVQMRNTTVSSAGGNQPHQNMQPYLVVNYIIALFGIFPSQS